MPSLFGIPPEYLISIAGAIVVVILNRFNIHLPFQKPTVPANPADPNAPADDKSDLEKTVEKVLLAVLDKLFKKETLPPTAQTQVAELLTELHKK